MAFADLCYLSAGFLGTQDLPNLSSVYVLLIGVSFRAISCSAVSS